MCKCDWQDKSTCKPYWLITSVISIQLNVRTGSVLKLHCS